MHCCRLLGPSVVLGQLELYMLIPRPNKQSVFAGSAMFTVLVESTMPTI